MSCISTPNSYSPGQRTKIVEQTLHINQTVQIARRHLMWGACNTIVLSILVYDLLRKPLKQCQAAWIYNAEMCVAAIFLINTIYNFSLYFSKTLYLQPVILSPTQKKLMGIKDSDSYFKTAVSPKENPIVDTSIINSSLDFTSTTPMNLSALSWLSPTVLNDTNSTSPNYSISSTSWVYHSGSSSTMADTSLTSRSPVVTTKDFITDQHSLSQYLKDVEEHEKKMSASYNIEQPSSNLLSSFWNHQTSKNANEISPMLRRCTYQLAPLIPTQTPSSPGTTSDESGSPLALQQHQELWRKLKVDPSSLTQWNANLRMWVSQTILQRLVKEFDAIDDSFQRFGLSDMRIGSVGLERLKKTSQNQQIISTIPSLVRMVPFLDLTPHQEYLVARIKELSKGGSMSEYRWNSGGTLNGKNWEEHLPTDAAVVMHLIATYLDSQLLPLPHHPDGRPFSSQYFIKSPEKPPKGRNTLILYQTQLNPPHYVIVDKNECFEVAKGRNNLFHTFLLFLHLLKTNEHGMLGRVNLGPSGVNILWVIDS